MNIKLLILLSCLLLVSYAFADQPSSDNYILIQRGFLTGNANQTSPPGSASYELTESSMLGIANDAETSTGYLNYPGFLQPNNHAPTIVLPDDFTFEEDDGLVVDFAPFINDINGDIVTISVSGNTEVIVDIVDFTVTFSATLNWNGTETLTFTANDNMERAVASDVVDIIVTPVNDDPTIVLPDDFTFDEDDGLVVDFTQYVDDIDLDVLTLTVAGNTVVTVDIVDLEVTFGATANWNGTETLTFTVDDGQGERVSISTSRRTATINEENNRATAEDDVDVIVNPVNDNPTIILPDDFTFDEDDELVVDFTQYVDDVDLDVLTLTVAGNTEIIVDIVDLEVTFGATANWNGTETLIFIVDDGQGERVSISTTRKTATINEENNRATAEDDVDIIVTPVNDDPTIVLPDDFTFDEDDELVVDFTQYVDDVDLDDLFLTVTGNTEITVDIDELEVTFGATENWNGNEILTFTVDDGQGERVSITTGRRTATKDEENNRATADDDVEVIVTPVNDDPTIVLPDDFTFDEDDGLIVDFIDFIDDIDLDDLTLTVTGNTEITVDINGFEVTFGATADWNGTETLTFIVDDNVTRATAEDDVDVIVLPVNDEPVLIGFLPEELAFTVVEDSMVTFSVDIEDIDSTIEYEWFVDDVLQTESSEEFVHIFEVVGDIEIKSIASDEDYEIETIWIVEVEEGSAAGDILPVTTDLNQNYPNPFNPTTTINYSIIDAGRVRIEIFNIKGEKICTLVDESKNVGYHSAVWNGKDNNGKSVASGMYFYNMATDEYHQIRKMLLIK